MKQSTESAQSGVVREAPSITDSMYREENPFAVVNRGVESEPAVTETTSSSSNSLINSLVSSATEALERIDNQVDLYILEYRENPNPSSFFANRLREIKDTVTDTLRNTLGESAETTPSLDNHG